jgi:hypothetical protein
MNQTYIRRSLEPVLKKAAKEFPAVVLTGPRQSGKTTLFQHLFGKDYRYVSLETPDADLLPCIKEKIDAERNKAGQYLLAGSQNLLLLESVTESLAGRSAMLRLLPLSRREAEGQPMAPLPWESRRSSFKPSKYSFRDLWKGFLIGSYPELAANPGRDANLWHASYVQTYLERDVRTLARSEI